MTGSSAYVEEDNSQNRQKINAGKVGTPARSVAGRLSLFPYAPEAIGAAERARGELPFFPRWKSDAAQSGDATARRRAATGR